MNRYLMNKELVILFSGIVAKNKKGNIYRHGGY